MRIVRNGLDWIKGLPEGRTGAELEKREEAILDAVRQGFSTTIDWIEVPAKTEKHTAAVFVSADALRIGDTATVRVSTNAETAQRIADHLGCFLLTPRVLDLVSVAAKIRIPPATQTSWKDGTMAFTSRMLEHHLAVEKSVAGREGLIDNVGKIWAITGKVLVKVGLAANYGWYVSGGGLRAASAWARPVLQSVGYAHNTQHVDYSQTIRLMKRTMVVDGEEINVTDCLSNPELAVLISHEGVLSGMRYPGIGDAEADTEPKPVVIPETIVTPSPGFWNDPKNWRKLMEQGDAGPDVEAWERVLARDGYAVVVDGDFDTATHNATVAWQAARGLTRDGVVGPMTKAKIGTPPTPKPVVPLVPAADDDSIVTSKIEAKNWSRHAGTKNPKKWIVIHTMEAREASTTAEAVAKWFAGPNSPQASAHFCIDGDSVVECVPSGGIAWHAPGANREGIGLEHAGYARQTEEQWRDEFSTAMLRRSARLAAVLCKEHGIPVKYIDRHGLRNGEPGFTTHNEVTFAFRKSTHVDPGKHFPMEQYLTWVREAMS